MVSGLCGGERDARYLGFFDCFNRELFYEAHEVLEDLWLLDRQGPDGFFYKGLIQLAGAFVHLQKGRPQPCLSLLRLARANLTRYPAVHHQLDLAEVLELVNDWEARVERARDNPHAEPWAFPKVHLRG